jgi:hypothetical protein
MVLSPQIKIVINGIEGIEKLSMEGLEARG